MVSELGVTAWVLLKLAVTSALALLKKLAATALPLLYILLIFLR